MNKRGGIEWILLAALGSGCRSPQQPRSWPHWEAERDREDNRSLGGRGESRFGASGGEAWGGGFGSEPGHHLCLRDGLPVPDVLARIWLRYSVAGKEPVAFRVSCEDTVKVEGQLPSTGHGDRFEWISFPWTATRAGPLQIHPEGRLRLDQVAILPEDRTPSPEWSPPVVRSGGLEVRATDRSKVFDAPWVLKILREQCNALEAFLGIPCPPLVTLMAVHPEEWPDPGTGAFQSGTLVYLRADELHFAWRNYPHELSHVFQERWVEGVPLFFREGVAFLSAMHIERLLFGREELVAQRVSGFRELLADKPAPRFGQGSKNPMFDAKANSVGHPLSRESYEWAYAILWEMQEALGSAFVGNMSRALSDPSHPGVRALQDAQDERSKCRALVRMMEELTGRDWQPAFRRWGL